MDFRSQECIYLRLSPQHKGHKCLAANGKIYISKDVLLNEFRFPYPTMFPNTSHSSPIQSTLSSHIPRVPPSFSTDPAHLPSSPQPVSPQSTSPIRTDTVTVPKHSQSSMPPSSSSPESITPSASPSLPVQNLSSSSPSPPPLPTQNLNTHPMITRSKTGSLKPKVLLTCSEPRTVKQALSNPDWLAAMKEEYSALMKNNTWSLVKLPSTRKAIGYKWVYRIKENPDGTINKYKARLVAKGFHQQYGFDFKETFSPVVKPVTIRIILTLALTFRWDIKQIDINNVFLHGHLNEEIYMLQPPGFEASDKSLVCKLNRSLYGLKQGRRAWYERLTSALLQFGLVASKCDPSLFTYTYEGNHLYVLVYVDDIIITGSSSSLILQPNASFALKDLGDLDYFLGIEVKRTAAGTLSLRLNTSGNYWLRLIC